MKKKKKRERVGARDALCCGSTRILTSCLKGFYPFITTEREIIALCSAQQVVAQLPCIKEHDLAVGKTDS